MFLFRKIIIVIKSESLFSRHRCSNMFIANFQRTVLGALVVDVAGEGV